MPARSLWGSSPRLAVPGSDRQVRKRRAQEPGGEGCTFPPRSPLQASLGDETAERCDFVTHPRGRGPRDNKSFAGVWAKTGGGHRAGKRSTKRAEPPAGSACLSPAPRSSARLGSAPIGSARQHPAPLALVPPRPARARPAPPREWRSQPASHSHPAGAPGGRTWAAGGSENRGG